MFAYMYFLIPFYFQLPNGIEFEMSLLQHVAGLWFYALAISAF